MKIHHLNCGTMCPICQRLVQGVGSWIKPGRLVCHCLLVESADGLVLIDTGFGSKDVLNPRDRLGRLIPLTSRPQLNMAETAIAQVRALGYHPSDVRHILPTHLDFDHIGGLADFPDAKVHIYKPELDQLQQPSIKNGQRYRRLQFEHRPHWVVYEHADDDWYGFASIPVLAELGIDLRLVPLTGHSKGHVGVALKSNDRWLLHCGDAYLHHSQITTESHTPAGLAIFEKILRLDAKSYEESLKRLQTLAMDHGDEVELFCAHDVVEFERYTKTTTRANASLIYSQA